MGPSPWRTPLPAFNWRLLAQTEATGVDSLRSALLGWPVSYPEPPRLAFQELQSLDATGGSRRALPLFLCCNVSVNM